MASPPLSSNCTGSGAPCPAAPPTSWPTSTGPAPPTAPPKRSTADSNTSAAPPSASATSPTTSPDHSSKQAASAPPYTAKCDEPHYFLYAAKQMKMFLYASRRDVIQDLEVRRHARYFQVQPGQAQSAREAV